MHFWRIFKNYRVRNFVSDFLSRENTKVDFATKNVRRENCYKLAFGFQVDIGKDEL
jgi:hypothetical protein